jgi:signal transduction histidine kinase
VLGLLDQTQEIFRYSRELEQKSAELEQLTIQLQHANDRLKELDLLKADFITTVTHELRTPITSIKALANILNDNADLPEVRRKQFLQVIISESERITRLINQVLDLERLQSVDADWELHTVDLLDLAETALRGTSGLMQEKGITCECSLPPLPSVEVTGNRDRLMQVIVNLLSNAVKFCPPTGGHIRLSLRQTADTAILEILDNGPGIAAEQADFIFEKFTQISDNSRGKPAGSGLGLFISRLIVQRHAGTLSLADGHRTGAHFIVKLPLLRTAQA